MRAVFSAAFLVIAALGASAQAGGFGAFGGRQASPVLTIAPSDQVYTTTVAGRLRPADTVTHSATVSGIVSAVRVVAGRQVSQGETLFTIDRNDATASYAPVNVTSRISGVVSSVALERNNEVRSGEAAVTVIRTDEFLLTAMVSDKDARSVDVGLSVEAITVNGETLSGTLIARAPEPDYATGLYEFQFRFAGAPGVYPGQFVTIELPTETVRGIFVPQSALRRQYGRYFVWLVDEQSALRRVEVSVGRTHEDDIQITSGVEIGQRVITRPTGNEREGAEFTAPAPRRSE